MEHADALSGVRNKHNIILPPNARRNRHHTAVCGKLGVCLRERHTFHRASNKKATLIIGDIRADTLKHYNSA